MQANISIFIGRIVPLAADALLLLVFSQTVGLLVTAFPEMNE
jgi:hypothetical protein